MFLYFFLRFNGCPIYAELSPVTDFREACCRQYELGGCNKGAFCNFMHLKQISRDLRRKLYGSRADYRGGGYYGAGAWNGDSFYLLFGSIYIFITIFHVLQEAMNKITVMIEGDIEVVGEDVQGVLDPDIAINIFSLASNIRSLIMIFSSFTWKKNFILM